MAEKVGYIQLGFENVEVMTIKMDHINFLYIDGVKEDYASDKDHQEICKRKTCSRIALSISKIADKTYSLNNKACWYQDATIFERILMFNDIMDITYLDVYRNPIETIFVPWKDDHNYEDDNEYQLAKKDDKGDLNILIEKK